MEELGHDQVRDLIVDRSPQEDDPLVEKTAVYVERALSARGLLDDHRHKWAHRPRFFRFLGRNPADCSNRLGPPGNGVLGPAFSQLPGVQSCPEPRPTSSLTGVHSFWRALACSTLIGLASATSSSTAW